MIGKKLDKYEIVRELGAGGMGAVYEARHIATARRVAIKVILGELRADDSLILRFQREARAAGSIESRHIAQVLDAGKDPESGAPYLVMELLEGTDLDALLKSGFAPFRPALALRIAAQALAGLERAHAASVIHRDIKPANIYIAESDAGQRVVKLVDFGIAKVKDDVTASREFSLTQTASLLGSPLYMSPEQARTSKMVDGRADIWSIGTVLYQMLAGSSPQADKTSLTELLLGICTELAKPIQEVAPWIPPEVARIVARSLEIDLNRRFGSATEMLASIAQIVPDWQQLDAAMFTKLTEAESTVVAERSAVDSSWELGTSTGPNSQRPSLGGPSSSSSSPRLSVPEALVATLVPPSQQRVLAEPARASSSSLSGPLSTSESGVNATSSPGRETVGADGLASTNRGDVQSPIARSRALPIAIAVGIVGIGALGIGVTLKASSREASGVEVTPAPATSLPPPIASSTSIPPSAPTPDPLPSALPPTASTARPVATSSSRPPLVHSTPSVTAATASASASAKPPAPAKPTATSSSPISRDFN
jgi:eukaryotic-like serine/threonine-protein kinase